MWSCPRHSCTSQNIQNINEIFENYDPQNSGKIDYRTFIENLLFKDESEAGENLSKSHIS